MPNRFRSLLLSVACLSGPALPAATLNLLDGTQVVAEIVEFSDGIYRLESPSLGTLRISEDRIRSIDYGAKGTAPTAPPEGVTSVQQILLRDPDLMAMILSLQTDPNLQALLSDPVLLQAIASGDTATLLRNESFLKLMQNPQLQRITETAKRTISGSTN